MSKRERDLHESTIDDGDPNEEERLGNFSKYDSANKAANVPPHSVNNQAAPAFISPEELSLLTSTIQSLTERLVESRNATKSKIMQGKATATKQKGKMSKSPFPPNVNLV